MVTVQELDYDKQLYGSNSTCRDRHTAGDHRTHPEGPRGDSSNILDYAVDDYGTPLVGLIRPTRLSQVCRAWRSVVIGDMPRLWSALDIRNQKWIIQLVELWIIRTGDAYPLDLAFSNGRDAVALLKLILPYADRWHRVSFHLNPNCEQVFSLANPRNLVTASVYSSDRASAERFWEVLNRSEKLRCVSWQSFVPQSTPWAQIEHVYVTYCNVQVLGVLPQPTRLTFLQVDYIGSTLPNSPPITLPLLGEIAIRDGSSTAILECIQAPSLQHLDISRILLLPNELVGDYLSRLIRFLERSACPLQTLALCAGIFNDREELDFADFLQLSGQSLRTLQELKFECRSLSADAILLLDPYASPEAQLLPSLRSFWFRGDFPPTGGLFGSMIQSRFLHGSLQSAYITLYGNDPHDEDVLILETLKKEGRNIFIRIHDYSI